MAASLNKVFLIGNLTRDPELRYIPSGQAVASFTLAVNRSYLAQTGEKKQETSFIRIVTWGRRAETCNEFLRKGSPVFVEGRIQSRSWEAQDGSKRNTVEVIASSVQFLGRPAGAGKAAEGAEEPIEEAASPDVPAAGSSVKVSPEELAPDDEVPF